MIPQLRDWHARYNAKGLTIVGIHSPEFLWEKSYDKVVAATKELGVAYPVVQDNDFVIWKRWCQSRNCGITFLQLYQPYVQNSTATTRPRNPGMVSGALLIQRSPVMSGAACPSRSA